MKVQFNLSLSMGNYMKCIEKEIEISEDDVLGVESAFDVLRVLYEDSKAALDASYNATLAENHLKEVGVERMPDFGDFGE